MVKSTHYITLCSITHKFTERKRAHAILYRPYEFFDHSSSISEYPGSRRVSLVEDLIRSGNFREARHQSHELIKATLSGIRYLDTYDRTLIRTIAPFAYIGWIAYSAAFILMPSQSSVAHSIPLWIPLSFILTAIGFCRLFTIQRWTLHAYILFPMFFWQDVTRKVYLHSSVFRGRKLDAKWIAGTLLGLVLTVVVLVVRHSVYLLLIGFSTESQGRIHQSCGLEYLLRCHRTFLAFDILARG
jgi:Phosphatidylinositolglycan class N (PIG-N)